MAVEDHNGEVVSPQEECPDCSASERSFDELAKGLADGKLSRRKALRMLGGTLVGASLASVPGVAWAARCRALLRKCTANRQCCSRNCIKNPNGNGRICGCPTGQTHCNNRCVTCSGGRVVNPATCQCECPPDTELCNNACVSTVCDPTTGEVFNPATCKCECPVDTELCGGQCLAVCAPPKTQRNPNSCACECPTGTDNCGDSLCCVEGTECCGDQCLPACPEGTQRDQNCQCAPLICQQAFTCGGVQITCGGSPFFPCGCFPSVEGQMFCGHQHFCGEGGDQCQTSAECRHLGPGFYCGISCCGRVCIAPCV